ncbi:hypothetical protein LF1_47900 [Rubripirellula obstinata]|uniref:HicB family protein n=1 Tax=Rubripirellula obstinata TaxID=406547 RepID=A0A5B1CMD9_9BACT|nr:toxin-antitoxin system HicB family antitoxin [Rubripirellula obstinata]KAA1262228.1 hypothetical protein LF1_47900 [Rubripirellula obstinata]
MESAKQATHANQAEVHQPSQHPASPASSTNRILAHTPASNSPEPNRSEQQSSSPSAGVATSTGSSNTGSTSFQSPATITIAADLSDKEKGLAILKIAAEAFASNGNWVVFYRDMLGVKGLVHRTFDTEEKLEQFQTTPQFAELQEMVAALRSQDTSKSDAVEAEKMITIRLPESLHKVLTTEAESMNLSINKLCISKLLQPVEGRFVPVQQGRRRGRRPGPQGSRKSSSNQGSQT